MEIHHDKHHQAYVNNLNAAIDKAPELAGKSLDDLMRGIELGARGGAHCRAQQWRRALESLAVLGAHGPGQGRAAGGQLGDAINSAFGDFAKFKEQFAAAARRPLRLGLGLAVSNGGKLAITSTPNQDNPLMDGQARRSSASTSGSTRTISSTRTSVPTTSRRGGTW